MASFAYNAFAYGTGAAGAQNVYAAMQTLLTTCGWTLVHSVGTYDNIYQSPNFFTGVNIFCYIELIWDGSLWLSVNPMQDYDSGTFTPINQMTTTPAWRAYGAAGTAYMRANQYSILLMDPVNGVSGGGLFRRYDNAWTGGATLSTGAISAGGTSVTTATSLVGTVQVGQTLMIQNFAHSNASANKAHAEILTITAVTATSISFSATTNAYDSGAIIGNALSAYGAGMQAPLGGNGYVIDSASGCVRNAADATYNSSIPSGSMVAAFLGADPTSWTSWTNNTKRWAMIGVSIETANNASGGPVGVAHHGYCVVGKQSAGPSPGTLFTDGVNVYVATGPGTGATGSPYYGWPCMGPTGATPNYATMQECFTPVGFGSNSDDGVTIIPAIPSPGASPINQLNQGLN
jgi:hypothetical protein